tara:strand:+ start:471 stop:830 length:360 start_codon:yes stop_codon:yes gene_type:complete
MPFPESQTLTSSRLCPIDGQLPCTYETDPSGAVHLVTALTSEQKIKEKVRGSRILILKLDMVSPGIFKCAAMIVAEDQGDDLIPTVGIIHRLTALLLALIPLSVQLWSKDSSDMKESND